METVAREQLQLPVSWDRDVSVKEPLLTSKARMIQIRVHNSSVRKLTILTPTTTLIHRASSIYSLRKPHHATNNTQMVHQAIKVT